MLRDNNEGCQNPCEGLPGGGSVTPVSALLGIILDMELFLLQGLM